MIKNLRHTLFIFLFIAFNILLSSCSSNAMHRDGSVEKKACHKNSCRSSIIETHANKDENYDLVFAEFSERGNIFDREKLDTVIQHIENEEKRLDSGVMVLVYVHGWKHNASTEDVNKFRKILKIISHNQIEKRKVIGVYVGWRGLSLKVEPLKTLFTYWGRKNVARQVGNGGVTELFLRLNKITDNKKDQNKNILVVSGHSFGSAVIISALKDILLERLINIKKVSPKMCAFRNFKEACSAGCYKSKPFGDGIVLVNPAVEANELLQIKEIITQQRCYSKDQPKLLHILSSGSDKANKYVFRIGQFLGIAARKNETELNRKIFIGDSNKRKNITLDEYQLDVTTVGNYSPFRTGKSDIKSSSSDEDYKPCWGEGKCVESKNRNNHLPVSPHEPVSIIYTDKDFINSHSDVFNKNVIAYIATAITENQSKNVNVQAHPKIKKYCFANDRFKFSKCVKNFRILYKKDFCSEFKQGCDG